MAEDEEEAGPTIFEAAADEEITATHWCDDPSNEDFSPSRLPFSRGLELTPHLFPQGVPLPQEPQRRQGRRRRQQPGVRPVCNCMPVCRAGCRNPSWMWTKKTAGR